MSVKLLTEHHLEFLSLKVGCTGSSESTHVKISLLEITCHGSYCLSGRKHTLVLSVTFQCNGIALNTRTESFKLSVLPLQCIW